LIAPGLIDLQINGGFGIDFSFDIVDEDSAEKCLRKVGKGILAHGEKYFLKLIKFNFSKIKWYILQFMVYWIRIKIAILRDIFENNQTYILMFNII